LVQDQAVLFIVILVCSTLLNRGVERRFRLSHGGAATAGGSSSRTVLVGTISAVSVAVVISIALIANEGWPSRMPQEAGALMKINNRKDMRDRVKYLKKNCTPEGEIFCGERQAGKTNILLLGDSRAIDIYMSLKTAYPEANIQTSYAMGCAPVFSPEVSSLSPYFPTCLEFNQARLQAALDAPSEDIIILAQNIVDWREEAVKETVERLRDAGKTVYVLGQFSFIEQRTPVDISIDMLRFDAQGGDLEKYIVQEPFRLDGEFAEYINGLGAVYISNKDFFFDVEYHLTDRETGKLLTYDGKHLNQFGAQRFGYYLQDNYPLPE
jgi:hypothetical protein